jgi:hypothetical protein
MGFNIGSILAGAAMGATTSMRNRMDLHEKGLAETKRLRQSAKIQEEFTERSESKKEKRKAERDAQSLRDLGYEPELIAQFLRGGDTSITNASNWAIDGIKKGVNVNTIWKSPTVTGSNLKDDTNAINSVMGSVSTDSGSQTANAFSIDPEVMSTIYAPKPTDKTLDALYATAVQEELKALKAEDENALVKAQTDKASYLLAMAQKSAASEKQGEPFNAFGKLSISKTFEVERENALQALGALGIVEGLKQTIDGSKQLQGLADLYVHKYTGESGLNTNSNGGVMSKAFEALRKARLRSGQDILTDYATTVSSSSVFSVTAPNLNDPNVTKFSYDDALQYAREGQVPIGTVVKVSGNRELTRSNGTTYEEPGIFHFVYLGKAFEDNGIIKTGQAIKDNFFKGAFFAD